MPTCVLDIKIIKNLDFGFTLNTQKDKKGEAFVFRFELS